MAASQYGPADARQLIGKRYDRYILMDTTEQILCPPSKRRFLLCEMWQCRPCSMDQKRAQVFVASFADSHEPWLATGRRLTRDQAQPCRKITSMFECFGLADSGNQSR